MGRDLHNSMKLWATPCRATQDGWVRAESSNKPWSTAGGNGKPPQYTCRENLRNCIKGQKNMTPKDESPRSEGITIGQLHSSPMLVRYAGKDWGQKTRVSEGEMTGWHHQCNERELGHTPGDGEGQRGLACCSPWGTKSLTWLGDWTTTNLDCTSHY